VRSDNSPEAVRKTVVVKCDINTAFRTWTEQIDAWWPKKHSRSGDPATTVGMERHADGRIYERTSEGVEYTWGKVIAWEPPRRFAYYWYLGSSPEQPTQVDVIFSAEEESATRVEVTHRGPEVVGEMWTRNVAQYDSSWDVVLSAYVTACSTKNSEQEQTE
jgi:uncharacterized protein YndB with AHSA1/START domain